MIRTYLIYIIFFISNFAYTQENFEKTIISNMDKGIYDLIELDENYLMVGRKKNSETDVYNANLIVLSNDGEVHQDTSYTSNITEASIFFNIHHFLGNIYILGTHFNLESESSKLWFLKLNEDFSINNQTLLNLPEGQWFSYFNSIIDSDNNFVIAGYTNEPRETGGYKFIPALYKIDQNGDSVNSNFMVNSNRNRMIFDTHESRDSNFYFAYGSRFDNIPGGEQIKFTKEFDSIAVNTCANRIFDFYSPVFLTDTSIVFYGHGNSNNGAEDEVAVSIAKDNMESLYYDHFTRDENLKEHPLMMNGIDINDNYIYVGGLSNWNQTNPFYSSYPSWFHMVKYDYELNRVWEKYFGGDAYYFPYSLKATSDGGCIVVGNRYDGEIQYVRDIYVIKVDSNGLITWTQSLNPQEYEVAVFPNPGKNYLQIRTGTYPTKLQIFNIKGQMVLEEEIRQNTTTIQTQSLSTGTYVWQLLKDGEVVEKDKWVKE